jgi:hypothetical protein
LAGHGGSVVHTVFSKLAGRGVYETTGQEMQGLSVLTEALTVVNKYDERVYNRSCIASKGSCCYAKQ